MSVAQSASFFFVGNDDRRWMDGWAYPRMNPTIDITAAVRPYIKRLESHADGSGKVSTNHS